MSDKQPNYELDDELLSAYLDDELSVDQRAAVEARLAADPAADPAAQHLLHALRSVSQAVQSLPQETLGRDLSEAVVRRARETKPTTSTPVAAKSSLSADRPAPFGGGLPKITIFSTTRGWFWASLALAAGLLIMVVQSGEEKAKKDLPPIAQRDRGLIANESVEQPARRALGEPGFSAPSENAPPASTVATSDGALEKTPAPATPMPAQPLGEMRDNSQPIAPLGSPIATATPAARSDNIELNAGAGRRKGESSVTSQAGKPAIDSLAQPSQAIGHAGAVGGALSYSAGGQKAESTVHESPLIVVHVVARPEAIRNKSFDRLLDSHDISVEPQPAKQQPTAFGADRFAKQIERESAASRLSDKAAAEKNMDMFLVEAPRDAIVKCLAGLNQDSNNYLVVDVEERLEPTARADSKVASKKVVESLSKFSRGTVPQPQKDAFDRYDIRSYYWVDVPGERPPAGSPRGGDGIAGSDVQQESKRAESLDQKKQRTEKLGRARRVQPLDAENRQAGEESAPNSAYRAPATDEWSKSQSLSTKLKAAAQKEVDQLQVLFVLSSEEATPPSAPPADRTK